MRRLFIFVTLLALALVPATAQELTTGTLEGTVVSEADGSALEGAIVTCVGPQGIKTATTDRQGRFNFRGLISGTYQVKAEAPGYTPLVQEGVRVYINRRTQLPFALQEGISEEITVTSQAPVVDLKSTTTGAQITVDDFAPYVPLGRNLVSVFSIAPGVSDGGSIGAANRSISGSSGLENAYFVDGVNITNSGYGAIGAYSIVYGSLGTGVTYEFLEEVQVKTGGFEAEFGQAGGGVVNSVVKTGTNSFQFDAALYYTAGTFEGERNDVALVPNNANFTEVTRSEVALSVGGPILKDKLFYFVAYNPIERESSFKLTSGDPDFAYDLEGDGNLQYFDVGETVQGGRTPAEVTRKRSIQNYAAKVSWFITPNHKVEGTAFGDPSDGDVGPQSPTSFLRVLTQPSLNPDAAAAATGLEWGGDQYALKYQGVLASWFFLEAQYSHKENTFLENGPGVDNRAFFDEVSQSTTGGAGFYENLDDKVDQFAVKLTNVLGPVELRYGYQRETIEWAQPKTYSGPSYTAYAPVLSEQLVGGSWVAGFERSCLNPLQVQNNPSCYQELQSTTGASVDWLTPDPNGDRNFNVTRTEFTEPGKPTDSEEDSFYAQVAWDIIPQLNLKAGLRYTQQSLKGAGEITLPWYTLDNTGITVGGGSTDLVSQEYEFDGKIAPRIGLAWDVGGWGKYKLYVNYAEYLQRVPSDLAVRAFSNEVGVENEQFQDGDLTNPALESICNIDTTGDGSFDSTTPCHGVGTTGLAGGGSIILDGTQLNPDSDVNASLGSNAALVTSDKTDLPMTKEYLAGFAWEINDFSSFELRYIKRELGTVLEDVQFASNEQTWNLFWGESGNPGLSLGDPFPGHGAGAFGSYVFANVGGNVDTTLFPLPSRNYDALEFVYNRRFNGGWMAYFNYRFSELKGNYEGSFRNDNGQSDPFLTSLFDFPAASAVISPSGDVTDYLESQTMIGQYVDGPLNTDRTHIMNVFASKQWDFGLNIGGRLNYQSGQPRGPLYAHPAYRNSGEVPGWEATYWWGVWTDTTGDGNGDSVGWYFDKDATATPPVGAPVPYELNDGTNGIGTLTATATGPRLWGYDVVERDFFGRNPALFTFDLHGSYDLKLRGGQSNLIFLLDIFNLFNENNAVNFVDTVETRPGSPNANFLRTSQFNPPRTWRIGVKFAW